MLKYFYKVLLIILFFQSRLFAQHYAPIWSVGNANLSPNQVLVYNSTFTSRYSFTGHFQIGANWLMPVAPNVQAKILWWNKDRSTTRKRFYSNWKWKITTVHTIFIPTLAGHLGARWHIIPAEFALLPFNVTMENDLYLTFPFSLENRYSNACGVYNFLTVKLGWRHTFGADSTFTLPTKGFWNLQASTFKNKNLVYLGIGYDSKIFDNLNLSAGLNFYSLQKNGLALEIPFYLYFDFGRRKKSTITFGFISGYLSRYKKIYFQPVFNFSRQIHFVSKRKKDFNEYLR